MTTDRELDILFYSRDPGGTNVLVPMIQYFGKEYRIKVYAKDIAVSIYERGGIDCIDINDVMSEVDGENVEIFLSKMRPKLVITGTSTIDRSEYIFWKECCRLGIKCLANVDSWAFYKERFSIHPLNDRERETEEKDFFFPDYVLAIDEEAREGMIEAGIPKKKVITVGYWHFLHIKKMLEKSSPDSAHDYREKMTLGNTDRKIILFVSEGFSELFGEDPDKGYGYHEKTIFEALESSLMTYMGSFEFMVIVRPHPKEKIEWWNDKIKQSPIEIIIDSGEELLVQIQASDLVTGMQTQCLNDAMLAGKKIVSIQIGLNKENPLFASRHNLINTALHQENLEGFISDFFYDRLKSSKFETDKSDIVKFIQFIKEKIENG